MKNNILTFDTTEQNVWLTSDLHGYHPNICSGSTTWDKSRGGTRDFPDAETMTKELVRCINKYVKPNDILIHDGDWTFGGIDKILKLRNAIYCENIYHILGNHDHHIENNRELFNGYDKINARDLFTSVSERLQFRVKHNGNKYTFFASHYRHLVWEASHKGVMHIYGHSHNSIEHFKLGKCMDVGVDAAFARYGEYRPFNVTEVIDILNKIPIAYLDHHNEHTT